MPSILLIDHILILVSVIKCDQNDVMQRHETTFFQLYAKKKNNLHDFSGYH